jgi:hypothetical protein
VNLGKLVRQVRREAGANPKKAATLGLMVLTALYFWLPLMGDWLGAGPAAPTTVADSPAPTAPAGPVADPAASPPVLVAKAQPKAGKPQHAWYEWVAWMEADPRARSAGPLAAGCDPFGQNGSRQAAVLNRERTPPVATDVSPASLKMVLAGTILSPSHRVARIDSRTYAMGDKVQATSKDGKPLEFVLTEIDARRVVLQRLGKQYELKIRLAKPAGRIELFSSMP